MSAGFKRTGSPEKPPIFTDKSFIERSKFILRIIKDINLTDITSFEVLIQAVDGRRLRIWRVVQQSKH